MVADDHEEIRHVLMNMLNLQPDLEVVGVASNGREAVELAMEIGPDVLLLDIRMPVMDGIEVIEELRKRKFSSKIIALSAHEDETYMSEAVRKGVDGYILKGSSMREVVEAVREVMRGRAVLQPEVAEPLARRFREEDRVLRAFQALLGEREDASGLLRAFCWMAREIVGADLALTYRVCTEGAGKPEGEVMTQPPLAVSHDRCPQERLSLYRSVLERGVRHLVELANDDQPLVCNEYVADKGEEGEVCSLVLIPVMTEMEGGFLVICLRPQPYSLSPSLLQHIRSLACQAGVLLDNIRRKEKLRRIESWTI